MEISSKIRDIAEAIGLPEKELEYAEDDVRKAFNNLEQAVYKLEEPFEDFVRDLQYKVEELEEIDEGQRCWKGYKKQGTKKMFGKTVNNCVKADESTDKDLTDRIRDRQQQFKRDSTGDFWDHVVVRKGFSGLDKEKEERPLTWQQQQALKQLFPTESADFIQKSIANVKPDDKLAKDIESAMSEAMDIPDQNAFDNIFKDRKNKPRKPKYYDNHPTKRSPQPYDKGPEDKQNKSSMGKVMEMYDDILYLMYIDGKLAMPTPIEKKDMNKYERLIKNVLPGSDVQFKGTPRHYYSAEELAEGSGKIRAGLAGIILLGGLLGLNNHQAQKIYDQSHQLQQLTQVYMVAKDRGDEAKMKDVKRRIGNHKMRLDLGKGDVDFDGRPGDDDIKDIDYINPIEER
tara:strand:- start:3106 stop:4305 length:1200 start_codon:yes stop_codon:yes gene_type:complete